MILLASHGDNDRSRQKPTGRPDWWLPPGFRVGTAKRNVLVAILYLLAVAISLDLLRGLLA
jgi:hypothetical protein